MNKPIGKNSNALEKKQPTGKTTSHQKDNNLPERKQSTRKTTTHQKDNNPLGDNNPLKKIPDINGPLEQDTRYKQTYRKRHMIPNRNNNLPEK